MHHEKTTTRYSGPERHHKASPGTVQKPPDWHWLQTKYRASALVFKRQQKTRPMASFLFHNRKFFPGQHGLSATASPAEATVPHLSLEFLSYIAVEPECKDQTVRASTSSPSHVPDCGSAAIMAASRYGVNNFISASLRKKRGRFDNQDCFGLAGMRRAEITGNVKCLIFRKGLQSIQDRNIVSTGRGSGLTLRQI
jgi:hypothetical protein